ncbi:MAG: M67 family metallopeptidase [Faecalibacterium sp.]
MKITLPRAEYEKMLAHARKNLPEESCGLIAGTQDEDGKHIQKVFLLTNTDHSTEHFTIDPKEHLASIREIRAAGLAPLGNWHSHPESPSRPSAEDKRLAFDSKASYLILSLADREAPVLNSFHVENGVSSKEELLLLE